MEDLPLIYVIKRRAYHVFENTKVKIHEASRVQSSLGRRLVALSQCFLICGCDPECCDPI